MRKSTLGPRRNETVNLSNKFTVYVIISLFFYFRINRISSYKKARSLYLSLLLSLVKKWLLLLVILLNTGTCIQYRIDYIICLLINEAKNQVAQTFWKPKAFKTRCVCETQMPLIMANSKDGQGHKDKYLDTSRKNSLQGMRMSNVKSLIFITYKLWPMSI